MICFPVLGFMFFLAQLYKENCTYFIHGDRIGVISMEFSILQNGGPHVCGKEEETISKRGWLATVDVVDDSNTRLGQMFK